MPTRLLLLEDNVVKSTNLRHAAECLSPAVTVEVHGTVNSLRALPPTQLATYDVILVDFDLATHRYGGQGPLADVDGHQVELTTGLGAIWHLNEVLQKPAYRSARASRPPTVVCSFVANEDDWSPYFVGAAYSWFGVPWFAYHSRVLDMAHRLEALLQAVADSRAGTLDWLDAVSVQQAAWTRGWATALDGLLATITELPRPFSWLALPDGTDSYRWLRALLRHDASTSIDLYRNEGLIDPGARVNPTTQLTDRLITALYANLQKLKSVSGRAFTTDWPALDADGRISAEQREAMRARLCAELLVSHVFWESDDVLATHDTQQAPATPAPLPLPTPPPAHRLQRAARPCAPVASRR